MKRTAPHGYLTTDEASEVVGLSRSTLANLRVTGDGPPFAKFRNGRIGYRMVDLLAYIDVPIRSSTSDPGKLPE